MKSSNILTATRQLLIAAALLLGGAAGMRAGEIQIGPAPCNQTTQQCTASAPPDNTDQEDAETQEGAEDATPDLSAVIIAVLLSLLS